MAAPNTTTLPLLRANIDASPRIVNLLDQLHAASLAQESDPEFKTHSSTIASLSAADRTSSGFVAEHKKLMQDKFIALEREKCECVYTLLRALGATTVIEAGTSFGVSTIYLALAVAQNAVAKGDSASGRVIATEHEAAKAAKAREHWKAAGTEIENTIELREGDLLQKLAKELPEQIDFVLLDSKPSVVSLSEPNAHPRYKVWAPLAHPTLELLIPNLRHGALIMTDNTLTHSSGYSTLLELLRAPGGPFRSTTLPYAPGGFELSVYLP